MCNDNEHCVKDIDEQSSSNGLNCDKVYGTTKKSDQASMPGPVRNDKINMNFDHLSVVSEECLSNGEDQNSKTEAELAVEAIYNNFQSTIPPLKHFENLSYKDIGPNVGERFDSIRVFLFFLCKTFAIFILRFFFYFR